MRIKPATAALAIPLLAALFGSGCLGGLAESKGPSTVSSLDGSSSVVVPAGWSARSDLNDQADLQVADLRAEEYLIVLSESKLDFENMTYEGHAQLTLETLMENLSGARIEDGPKQIQINGFPAIQYEVRGSVQGVNVVYLHTTVSGDEAYHQILAWTLPSKFQRNRSVLESVIQSFEEGA